MNMLAIETATEACSCALASGARRFERHEITPRGHADRVLKMVDAVLVEAGVALASLDAIAFGRGPGSFTGVRIAASVAQGLSFGAALPVVGVSTLRALAQGVYRQRGAARVLSALDARMSEVYWGRYECVDELMQPMAPEGVMSPAQVVADFDASDWAAAGSGWSAHGDALMAALGFEPAPIHAELLPHATDVLTLAMSDVAKGAGGPPESALPVYLRDRVTR